MAHLERVVVLVDMDCFYCQVEEKLNPNLQGKPIAVVQYNAWRGGGIIAVNYPARDRGVTRHMRGDEAKEKCPDIQLVKVPNIREKADLTKYREAGKRVAEVLQTFTPVLERASVDEAYLDITEVVNKRIAENQIDITADQLKNTHVAGSETIEFLCGIYNAGLTEEHNLKLAIGGAITEEIRAAVLEKTGYKCSAGIAHNKILAKLGAGLHKPNQQTILPQDGVRTLFETLPLRKIRNLGGKFGVTLSEDLNIKFMGELERFSEKELAKRYDEKTANWLYNIARGIDMEPVSVKLISKSIGCCKKFPGRNALFNLKSVNHWTHELALELSERLEQDLEENNRKAKQIIVSFVNEINKKEVSSSRTVPLYSYEVEKIQKVALEVLNKFCLKPDGSYHIKFIGYSVGKFEDNKRKSDISVFFKNNSTIKEATQTSSTITSNASTQSSCSSSSNKPKGILAMLQNVAQNQNQQNTEKVKKDFDGFNNNTIQSNKPKGILAMFEKAQNSKNVQKENISSEEVENTDECYENINDGYDSDDSQKTVFLDSDYYEQFNYKKYEDYFDPQTGKKLSENQEIEKLIVKTTKINKNEDIEITTISKNEVPEEINMINAAIDVDMIEEDAINDDKAGNVKNNGKDTQESFFLNYFKSKEAKSESRDFNTSKILEEDVEDCNEENEEFVETNNVEEEEVKDGEDENAESIFIDLLNSTQSAVNNHEYEDEQTINEQENYDNIEERCPDCNKMIKIDDMQSHKDYHFALSIVQEEKSLYKVEKPPQQSPKKEEKGKSKKRKLSNDSASSTSSKKLTHFFTKANIASSANIPTEICPECGKNILINELEVHIDFHAAKKLHLELNKITNNTIQKTMQKTTTSEIKGSKTNTTKSAVKVKSVLSFFKPTY